MKKLTEKFIRSVYGGIMVSFGCLVYLSSDIKYIGAILFSLGLFTICEFGFGLFTGKVGYVFFKGPIYLIELLVTLLGNFVGCFALAKLAEYAKPSLVIQAVTLSQNKLAASSLQNFLLACMCGVMMFIAVDVYKTRSGVAKYLGIFLAVPLFIICGFEHSIAKLFLFSLASVGAVQFISFSLITVLGNALGAAVFSLFKIYDKNQKTP